MNKLEIYNNGGEPHTLDDLKFVEKALRDGIINFGKGFNASGVMAMFVSGLTSAVVLGDTVFSDGLVMRNGEMFYVTGGTVSGSAPSIYINFDETNDSNGTKTFENLTVLDTYKIRAAYVTGSPTGDTVNVDDMQGLSTVLERMVTADPTGYLHNFILSQIAPSAWINIGATGNPAFTNGWVNYGSPLQPLRIRKTKTNEIVLSGTATIPTYTYPGTSTIFVLDVADRPLKDIKKVINVLVSGSTYLAANLTIYVNGYVDVVLPNGNNHIIYMGDISFYLD
jgi:hypothetical protein